MPLPKAIRSRTPASLRDHPGLRALALAAGLIPPRSMHTPAESELLRELARDARCVVEIGVYEGSSAVVFCQVLAPQAELHLIDPFSDDTGWALRPGSRASAGATRRAVTRRCRSRAPKLYWHVARSQDVGRDWAGPPADLVFIDGDHSPEGCREDWEVWHQHVKPGGAVAFHDARRERPGGAGGTGPTAVVIDLFRADQPPAGWRIVREVDTMVVVSRAEAD